MCFLCVCKGLISEFAETFFAMSLHAWYSSIAMFYMVYLLGSEGVHIVPTIRRHQLGDVISLVHGIRNKANTPH